MRKMLRMHQPGKTGNDIHLKLYGDKRHLRTGAQTSARYSGLFRLKLIFFFVPDRYLSVLKQ
ncbi:hypothetical protein [Pseudomonas syringae group genomosp. 3]|uniref:hypothetical protein n=1 Tax=Pseudomonas syringae group genomosp. 3 TaxID=251701 RepID=UPI0011C3F4F8|nr:hypothetical protein [Pseudomonas syringae group genomosp. 3]